MLTLSLPSRAGSESGAEGAEDRRLRNDIERALLDTSHLCLRRVSVSVRGRRVTLRGQVISYYLKQLSQATAMRLVGNRELRNEITVLSG